MVETLVERSSFDESKNLAPSLKTTSFPSVEHRSKVKIFFFVNFKTNSYF